MIGGTFNTVIGFIFLAIVIVSPDGLMGLWDKLWDGLRRRGRPPDDEAEGCGPGGGYAVRRRWNGRTTWRRLTRAGKLVAMCRHREGGSYEGR